MTTEEMIEQIIQRMKEKFQMNDFCYPAFVKKSFNKFLRDEISAATSYIRLAQNLKDKEYQEELLEHAKEEFEHYQELIEFAYNHGFGDQLIIVFDNDVVNPSDCSDDTQILQFVQNLEMKAIKDYKLMACLAMKFKDLETHQFFMELMKDEQDHFDDFANKLGQHRELGA
jgi:bacterioferritin (cytochrome b1)